MIIKTYKSLKEYGEKNKLSYYKLKKLAELPLHKIENGENYVEVDIEKVIANYLKINK